MKTVALALFALVAAAASATPHYPHFLNRQTQNLDGTWRFHWFGTNTAVAAVTPATECRDIAAVPGVFDTALHNFGQRGTALYQRTVCAKAGLQRLIIGGLGLYGKVWWDDQLLGEIKLPYSEIHFDFENTTDGEHRLTILVDNQFKNAPLFKPDYDFYGYGGIYRSVLLQTIPAQRLETVAITTLDLAGRIRVNITTANVPDNSYPVMIGFDRATPTQTINVDIVNNAGTFELTVPNAKIWSPATPNLHTLLIGHESDLRIERFGLRTITTQGRKILLNNTELKLFGVNRHEAHPQLGPVSNTHLMLEDIQLVKYLNANFIRAVHYQHDPEFYELCDEAGMLVWAESLGWGLNHTALLDNQALLLEETRILGTLTANHPSVIINGFLNECASDHAAVLPLYQKLSQTLRTTAPNTLVSFASNRLQKDKCFSVCDVVSLNYYPGWIWPIASDRPSSEQIPDYIADLAKWFDNPANKDVYDKPLITSETGCCGVYGVRDRALAQWSEEYQADYLKVSIQSSMSNPRFTGVTIWQMFDTRSFVNMGQVRGKFRGYNNAGLLDEYRRPKMAYDEVRALFGTLNR